MRNSNFILHCAQGKSSKYDVVLCVVLILSAPVLWNIKHSAKLYIEALSFYDRLTQWIHVRTGGCWKFIFSDVDEHQPHTAFLRSGAVYQCHMTYLLTYLLNSSEGYHDLCDGARSRLIGRDRSNARQSLGYRDPCVSLCNYIVEITCYSCRSMRWKTRIKSGLSK